MTYRFIATLLAASALGMASAGQAVTLYSQAPDGTENAYSSQDDPNSFGNFATLYDDFTLASSATITSVDFTGVFFNPSTPASPSSFTISLFGDAAGQPGSLLGASLIPGDAGQTCVGAVCSYSAAVNFAVSGGSTYWLAIVPTVGFPPQWGWNTAVGGNGIAYQDFFGARSPLVADAAFTLNGTTGAVPEPASWALMIGGFALVGAGLRRRSVTAAFATA